MKTMTISTVHVILYTICVQIPITSIYTVLNKKMYLLFLSRRDVKQIVQTLLQEVNTTEKVQNTLRTKSERPQIQTGRKGPTFVLLLFLYCGRWQEGNRLRLTCHLQIKHIYGRAHASPNGRTNMKTHENFKCKRIFFRYWFINWTYTQSSHCSEVFILIFILIW